MIIGAPKIQDFPPLQEKQLGEIITQIQNGFNQGAKPEMPVSMPCYAIASMIQTIFAIQQNVVITAGLLKHCVENADIEFSEEQKVHLSQILPNLFPPPPMPNMDEILANGTEDKHKD